MSNHKSQQIAERQYLKTADAARYLGVSKSWLDKKRCDGSGPVYSRIGGTIIYRTEDLDLFVECRRRRSTSER
jgi:hypothetical protein